MCLSSTSELLARLVVDLTDEALWTEFVDLLATSPVPSFAQIQNAVSAFGEQAEELVSLRLLMSIGALLASPACDDVYALAHRVALDECLDVAMAAEVRQVWSSKGGSQALSPVLCGQGGATLRWEARVADAVRQAGMTRDTKARAELYAEAAYCVYTAGMPGLVGEARAALLRQATSWLEESSRQAPFSARSVRLWVRLLLDDGRISELVAWLTARVHAAESRSEAIRCAFVLARIHSKNTRNFAATLESYRHVLALMPAHEAALHALAALYSRAKAWDELYSLYVSQFDAPGVSAKRRDEIARSLARLAKDERSAPDDAARWYEVLRAMEPADEEALQYLRGYFSERKQWGKLRRAVEEALLIVQGEQDDREPHWRAELENLEGLAHDEDAQVQSARDSWRVAPGDSIARNTLLTSYERAGRSREALGVLQRECELLDDSHPEILTLLAQLHRALKECGDQGLDLRRVLERRRRLEPANPLVLRELSVIYDAEGRDEDAALIEETLAATADSPTQSVEFLRRAAIRRFERLNDARGAIQCLFKALRASPDDGAAYALLLRYARSLHRSEEVVAWLRERLHTRAAVAESASERRELISLLEWAGQVDGALSEAMQALRNAPYDKSLARQCLDLALRTHEADAEAYVQAAAEVLAVVDSDAERSDLGLLIARVLARGFSDRSLMLQWYSNALIPVAARREVLAELAELSLTRDEARLISERLSEIGDETRAAEWRARQTLATLPSNRPAPLLGAFTLRPGDSTAPRAYVSEASSAVFQAMVVAAREEPTGATVALMLKHALTMASAARALKVLEANGSVDLVLQLAHPTDLVTLIAKASGEERVASARWAERMVLARPEDSSWVECAAHVLLHASESARYRRVMRAAVDATDGSERKRGLLVRWIDAEESVFLSPSNATERSLELVHLFPQDTDLGRRYGVRAARSGEHRLALAALLAARVKDDSADASTLLRIAEVAESAGDYVACVNALQEARLLDDSRDAWMPIMERCVRQEVVRQVAVTTLVEVYESRGQWLDSARLLGVLAESFLEPERRQAAFRQAYESSKQGRDAERTFSFAVSLASEMPGDAEGWWTAFLEATTPGRCMALSTALDIAAATESNHPLDPDVEWEFREALVTRAMADGSTDPSWINDTLVRMLVLRPQSEWAQEVLLSRLAAAHRWDAWVSARASFASNAEAEENKLHHIEQGARVCLDNLDDPARALALIALVRESQDAVIALLDTSEEALLRQNNVEGLRALYTHVLLFAPPTFASRAASSLIAMRETFANTHADRRRWLELALADADGPAIDEVFVEGLLSDQEFSSEFALLVLAHPRRLSNALRARAHEARALSATTDADRVEDLKQVWALRHEDASVSADTLKAMAHLLRIAPEVVSPLAQAERWFNETLQGTVFARALSQGAVRNGQLELAEYAAEMFAERLEAPALARQVWESFCDAGHIPEPVRAQARDRWMALAERSGRASDVDALLARAMNPNVPLPPQRDLLERLARLRAERLGDRAGAARVWKLVLDADPNHACALAEVQELYEQEGDDAALADILERRLGALPSQERERIYEQLLALLERTGQHERAVLHVQNASDAGFSMVRFEACALRCAALSSEPTAMQTVLSLIADDDRVPTPRRVWALEQLADVAIHTDHQRALKHVRKALHLDPQTVASRARLVELMAYADVAFEASATLLPFVQASGDVRAVRATLDTFLAHEPVSNSSENHDEMAFCTMESMAPGAGLAYALRGLERSLSNADRVREWCARLAIQVVGGHDSALLDTRLDACLQSAGSHEVAAALSRLGLQNARHLANSVERRLRYLAELLLRGAADDHERHQFGLLVHDVEAGADGASVFARAVSPACWAAFAVLEEAAAHWESARLAWSRAAAQSLSHERMRYTRESLRVLKAGEVSEQTQNDVWLQTILNATSEELQELVTLPMDGVEFPLSVLDALLDASGHHPSLTPLSDEQRQWQLSLLDRRMQHAAGVSESEQMLFALRRSYLKGSDAKSLAECAEAFASAGATLETQRRAWWIVVSSPHATPDHVAALIGISVLAGNPASARLAIEHYERISRVRPKDLAVLYRALGLSLDERGQQAEACIALDFAFRADPTHVATLWRLAELHVDLGQWSDAKRCYRALLLQKSQSESGRRREDIYVELEKIERELQTAVP